MVSNFATRKGRTTSGITWGDMGPKRVHHLNYLHVFITNLRKKIEPNPSQPRYILTEPWVGYRFQAGLPIPDAHAAESKIRIGERND